MDASSPYLNAPLRSEAEVLAERQRTDRIAFLEHADHLTAAERSELMALKYPPRPRGEPTIRELRDQLANTHDSLADIYARAVVTARRWRQVYRKIKADMAQGFGPTPQTLGDLHMARQSWRNHRAAWAQVKARRASLAAEIARREGVGPLPVRMLGGERVA